MRKTLIAIVILTLINNQSLAALSSRDDLPGLKYEQIYLPDNKIIHALQVDPKYFSIDLALANEIGDRRRESVATIAKANKALAAINGGFFRVNGNYTAPAGILKYKEQWHGIAYRNRGAIGWNNTGTSVLMDIVNTNSNVIISNKKYRIHGLNMPVRKNRNSLYSMDIIPTLRENEDLFGTFYVLEQDKITQILSRTPNNIVNNSYLFFIPNDKLDTKIGATGEIAINIVPTIDKANSKLWTNCEYILGGAPLLIKHGVVITDYSTEKLGRRFVESEHARTAVGILENGDWLFIVAEKNSLFNINGLTIPELATLMHKLGCTQALNLDGGSSSTLYLHDKVMNHLEDEENDGFSFMLSRRVTDAIVIAPREN